ncbi:MAG: Xaa-Pro peptidase family protein [Asticcacaulis sp.]|nr:Xaa-Pro peptidase family protein [Asticcacaulis sp.]
MIGSSTPEAELAKLSVYAHQAPAIIITERLTRIEKARKLTRDMGADALLVGAGASLNYFAGVPWGASERLVGMLIPVTGDPLMICPFFELGSLEADMKITAEFRLWQEHESPHALIGQAMGDWGAKVIAVDPAMSFEMVSRLGPETGLDIREASSVINGCRMYKSAAELALMQQAKDMTILVHKAVARMLYEGITTKEVNTFIEAAHRKLGASGNSFVITQFGRGTAFPHGLPGEQRLKEGDMVLVDTGCYVQGYTSDITRTYIFGQPKPEYQRVWDIEKEAQAAAFARVEVGLPCEAVDYAARAVLEKAWPGAGLHSAGHAAPHRSRHWPQHP